ncbi:MAG: N-acetyl sugar amidotransferase [Thermoplasmata archaeon]|nr:MAG: N-acetyl sugar amidotransferase [Thermoplasmata archaeon]
MRYCKKCGMPDTRPGLKIGSDGVCEACKRVEKRKKIDWKSRQEKLRRLARKFKRSDGYYDCIIAVSGGKDSYFQTYIMKEELHMNPLLVCVKDPFSHTKTGEHNLKNLSETFECDLITYTLNPSTTRKMLRIAFEEFGSPNWPIDLAIYSIPLKIAYHLKIPLIVYGENIAYEYGGPNAKDTYSAKDQIKNDVVKPIDWEWWYSKGIRKEEVEMIKYPSTKIVDALEPIYLSYFYPWDGRKNYELAKQFGFRDLSHEWKREGFIEDYDQIDSVGYLVHPWLKYPKYGHARATDVASLWIRLGYITREEGIELVKENDHKLDQKALDDFLKFSGYTDREFWNIVEKFWNREIFEKVDGRWRIKHPIWER